MDEQEIRYTAEQKVGAVEAILFAMAEPVMISTLCEAMNCSEDEMHDVLVQLNKKYDQPNSGLRLTVVNKAVTLSTKSDYYPALTKVVKGQDNPTLTDGAMEVLSIIAYKQPITRSEIEEIRNSNCLFQINKLLEFNLIKELGRKKATGRPIMYGTTDQFLKAFGIQDLASLPKINDASIKQFKQDAETSIMSI